MLLLLDETGTGKELVARALYEGSRAAEGPFIAVNCGAVARELVASTLFGHRKGAFTGATDARRGAYGKWIGLDADNGRTYVYCHLSSRTVSSGTEVAAGQLLGKVGVTGNVRGPHLHFEDHPLGPFVYAKVRKPTW